MVRVLHTADVHLAPDANERQAALREVLRVAEADDVDLVTIGGDLFDSETAAEQLRDTLRDVFSDRSFQILTIPGNHDADAFRNNLFFGGQFIPATETPFGHFISGDDEARVTTLPYTPRVTDELLVELRDRKEFSGPEFLLLHCSLEAPIQGSIGNEEAQRYFPVTKEQLDELGFDYYLAGHYHSPHLTDLPSQGSFIYPGTPVSVTRKETGRRSVVLIDTDGTNNIEFRRLDAFHHDILELRVMPGEEDTVFDEIRSQIATWDKRPVDPVIKVDGFIDMDESAFQEALLEASDGVPIENDTRTVEHVLTHPLFQAFQAKLDERDELHAVTERDDYEVDSFQDDVWETTLDVFAKLVVEGDLE